MTVYTIIKLYLNNRIVTLMLPHFCLFCDNIIHARLSRGSRIAVPHCDTIHKETYFGLMVHKKLMM